MTWGIIRKKKTELSCAVKLLHTYNLVGASIAPSSPSIL